MIIYIVLLCAILLLNSFRKSKSITDKQFCTIICIAMILITGLRHNSVGADTTVYYLSFQDLKNITFDQLMAQDKRDWGYYIVAWLIAKYTGSFEVLTLLAATIFYVPVSILIEKHSDDCGLSYIVLMAFNFFQFSMTGIRQTMALGFAILFLEEMLKKRPKTWKMLLWIIIGTALHKSCLIMLVFLLIRLIRNNKKFVWFVTAAIPVLFVFRNALVSNLMTLFEKIGFDDYTIQISDTTGGLTTYLVYILIFAWGLIFTKIGKKEGDMPVSYMVIMGFATALQSLVFVNSIFFRIVWYFSILMIIYIPRLITSTNFTKESRHITSGVMYAAMLFMYLFITMKSANVVPYNFFWEMR